MDKLLGYDIIAIFIIQNYMGEGTEQVDSYLNLTPEGWEDAYQTYTSAKHLQDLIDNNLHVDKTQEKLILQKLNIEGIPENVRNIIDFSNELGKSYIRVFARGEFLMRSEEGRYELMSIKTGILANENLINALYYLDLMDVNFVSRAVGNMQTILKLVEEHLENGEKLQEDAELD